MAVFAILFHLSRATWWNFSESEFPELRRKSYEKPIFVVCYSSYCPHCSGLPEGTRQYSDSDGNRSDVYVTMINCAESSSCSHFKVTGTPHMVLVIGEKRKYWPITPYKDGKQWNILIDRYLSPNIRQIYNQSEFESAIREPTDGGSTFYSEAPSSSDPIIERLEKISGRYRLYNDTFIYKIDPLIKSAKLSVYLSPLCSIQFNSSLMSVDDFVEMYKFGSLHRYDSEEYSALSKSGSYALIGVEDSLFQGQKDALALLPKSRCGQFTFGWVASKESKEFLKKNSLNVSDLPCVVAYDRKSNCRAISQARALEADKSGFLQSIIDGSACSSSVAAAKTYGGVPFAAVYIAAGLSLVTLARSIKSEGPKEE